MFQEGLLKHSTISISIPLSQVVTEVDSPEQRFQGLALESERNGANSTGYLVIVTFLFSSNIILAKIMSGKKPALPDYVRNIFSFLIKIFLPFWLRISICDLGIQELFNSSIL